MPRPIATLLNGGVRVPKKYGTRYPWDKWFRKRSFTLTQGKEFKITLRGMYHMIRNRASARGVSLQVLPDEEKRTIKVVVKGRVSP